MGRDIGRDCKVYMEAELGMLLCSIGLLEGSNCHVFLVCSLMLMLMVLSDGRKKLWIEKILIFRDALFLCVRARMYCSGYWPAKSAFSTAKANREDEKRTLCLC